MDVEDKLTPEQYNAEVSKEYEVVFPTASLLPGVSKLVEHLKSRKIPIGISTGSSDEAFAMKTKVTFFFRGTQTICSDCALTISDIDKRFFAGLRTRNGEKSLRATFFDFML